MVLNPGIKLNLFTQPIDEKYCSTNNASIEYYSYEGCYIQELDNLINKSDRNRVNDEELFNEDLSNLQNEKQITKESVGKNRKLSDYLTDTWKENLKIIKHSTHGQSAAKENKIYLIKNNLDARKLTFDVGSSKLEGSRFFQQ